MGKKNGEKSNEKMPYYLMAQQKLAVWIKCKISSDFPGVIKMWLT